MNKFAKIFTGTAFSVVVAGTVIFISCAASQTDIQTKPVVTSFTTIPDVPKSATFAGEEIALERYDMKEKYDRELTGFTYTHNLTTQVIKRANRIFPIIEPILKEEGVPDDLKYLAAIESSLNVRALSPARAAGLWQIMEQTGREFGLEVNSGVDERYHIEKSTRVAAKYLKKAYDKYGSWMAAAASYNAGMGRISSEMDKQNADDVFDLLLVEETTRYPFRMMAMKEIMENPYKYGFVIKPDQLYKPIGYTTDTVRTTIEDLTEYANSKGLTYAQVKEANAWLRDRKLPNKSEREYVINLPKQEDLYYVDGAKPYVHNNAWVVE